MHVRKMVVSVALAIFAPLVSSCELIDSLVPLPTGGGGLGGGAAVLVIEKQPLTGFTVHEAAARQNHPGAGDPSYVYLEIGKDAVRLPSPAIDDFAAPSLFVRSDSADIIEDQEGFTVVVNSRLSYRVDIRDFEGEVSLFRVELRREGSQIGGTFYFPATGHGLGGGVAHGLTITATVDGTAAATTPGTTIEVR